LAQKAQEFGYHPEIILAGRRLNDTMGDYVANQIIKLMIQHDIKIKNAHVLMLGITFKENCPDVRNTKVVDIIRSLQDYGVQVTTFDPMANPAEVQHEYQLTTTQTLPEAQYDAIVLGVAHQQFSNLNIENLKSSNAVVYDVKGFLPENLVDKRL
jgi:UDP-N-acetyl-D-galactosamine dehydrogenase